MFEPDKYKFGDVRIEQKPVNVTVECPHCGTSMTWTYKKFTEMHGQPSDWPFTTINCAMCKKTFQLDTPEWD